MFVYLFGLVWFALLVSSLVLFCCRFLFLFSFGGRRGVWLFGQVASSLIFDCVIPIVGLVLSMHKNRCCSQITLFLDFFSSPC